MGVAVNNIRRKYMSKWGITLGVLLFSTCGFVASVLTLLQNYK
mgnify:CR=1 FL=1